MSKPEDSASRKARKAAFKRLDGAVDQALAQVRDLRARVSVAEARNSGLETLLERFESGGESPSDYLGRMRSLEAENGDLRMRLEKGRDAVERLLSRIRFLEEQS